MSRQEGRYIDVNLLGDITKTVDGVLMVRYDDIMEITPIEALKNGIGCHECCVSYNTAVQREQDAYDSGFAKAIEDVLEIIEETAYEEDEFAEWTKTKSWHTVMRERVKALKEGKG